MYLISVTFVVNQFDMYMKQSHRSGREYITYESLL